MNAPEHIFLPDVQSTADTRSLAIQKVGVKGLRYPLQIEGASGEPVATVATLAMTVGLPPEVKGTHMSRFVELLEARRGALTQDGVFRMLEEMLLRLDARNDGRGKPYYWIAFERGPQNAANGTDLKALKDHKIAITPLRLDLTDEQMMTRYDQAFG